MSLAQPARPGHCGRKRRADSDLACPGAGDPLVFKRQRQSRESVQQRIRFWDDLSKVWLTQGALREFDRRRVSDAPREQYGQITPGGEALIFRDIGHFACLGGPSLTHLRGYANSTNMSRSSAQSRKRSARSGRSASTKAPTSSPYTANYEQKLIDAGVYPNDHLDEDEVPANEDDILARLSTTRASLSPSRFTEQDFKPFRRDIRRARTETSTMQKVFSTIDGGDHGHRAAADVVFTSTKPMVKDLAQAKPDLYDGVVPETIDPRVRAALQEYILPQTSPVPAAANFFTEGKSESGRADVGRRQALHDGALGARGMHALQNYGKGTPVYDGRAYSFSSTYHDGQLKMYAHHPTAPKQPGANPEYYMTQLRSFSLTNTSGTFREGAAAYRNLRDYAKEQRDALIDQANKRASTLPASTSSSRVTTAQSLPAASFSADSDTSLDELSRDEVTVKRARPNKRQS